MVDPGVVVLTERMTLTETSAVGVGPAGVGRVPLLFIEFEGPEIHRNGWADVEHRISTRVLLTLESIDQLAQGLREFVEEQIERIQ